ncbi:hypothetical protein BurJ1DRAFT_1023 [Burkholderiales bacterium JOSHI_001]|nr:hypothetical protein BurJ1DRAFT_1023 [Burkholderiales bacterium JOSHI_001]
MPRPTRSLSQRYARSRAQCDWLNFDDWQPQLMAQLADAQAPALPPFHLLSLPGVSAAQQRDCGERWMAQRLLDSAGDRRAQAPMKPGSDRQPGQRLRVGYLSGDFHQHATAWLMVELLEAHDHRRFDVQAFSYGPDDGGPLRDRVRYSVDGFTDLSTLDDVQAAQRLHAAGLDILVDLKGYTAGTRTALMGWRTAPVQVNYLGYPGSMGGHICDYLVSDAFVTPPEAAGHYSEALALMPHSYQPHGHAGALPAATTRQDAGLPEGALVLCNFNQAYKFTPQVFGLWCELLERAPGSVLWLLADEQAQGNLRQEALARGINPHRLVFAPPLPQAQHLARLALADLVLDTLPYNAHTTASDALWAGVPVLTCAGDTFAARVAGSLLHAVGLPELVTHRLDDYVALGHALLARPRRLRAVRARLARLRADAALFNVPAYARSLESLYEAMWARHAAGLAPATLHASA